MCGQLIFPSKRSRSGGTLPRKPTSLEEHAAALEENHQLKAHIAELEAARDVAAPVGKNPLIGYDSGQIVDLLLPLPLPKPKLNAVLHDLFKETKQPSGPLSIDQHFAALVELLADQPKDVVVAHVKKFAKTVAEASPQAVKPVKAKAKQQQADGVVWEDTGPSVLTPRSSLRTRGSFNRRARRSP